ncbi:U6 snRNA phosphodiesterase Usb1 [Nemania sp. FL0031]|nr:U6 snRNA phosphodiesterase Usb1 [Nemania sp. FL0031]
MGLVDYSSDTDGSEEVAGPLMKKQKTSNNQTTITTTTTTSSTTKTELPPLPSAFHDLYASTVRVSASDDPTLHQGRKRVNPHKVGNWPSHLYIEWHPTPAEQATLTTLLTTLQSNLTSSLSSLSDPITITSFLTSDLGAPQPLHISLSRPIVLSTTQKDRFLSNLQSSIRGSGIAPFELTPLGLEWHRTAESARSFLVLRVGSTQTQTPTCLADPDPNPNATPDEKQADDDVRAVKSRSGETTNPHLTSLLRRTNGLVTAFGQPALYAFTDRNTHASTTSDEGSAAPNTDIDKAFHISIAWSFAAPSAEVRRLTAEAFHSACKHTPNLHNPPNPPNLLKQHSNSNREPSRSSSSGENPADGSPKTVRDAVAAMHVRVDGIKAKIGNVVTHVPLPDPRGTGAVTGTPGGGLFGI